jgi:hypothetical protein
MKPSDIAAYIGAAAWLPQIGTWIYGLWTKPKLRIVPSATVMLTYTNLGPAVQLTASLSTERRDALIERMELELCHELGEKRHLTWVFVSEYGQQITAPTGEVINFGRNQPATAIKITTETLTDRQILLQDPDFAKRAATLGDDVLEHYRFLKTKEENPMKALFESKEIRPAREYFERSFYWKPGNYTFEISLKSASSNQNHLQKFAVVLSAADSDRLASNCKSFEEYVSAGLLEGDGIPSKYPVWKWVQTRITPMLVSHPM